MSSIAIDYSEMNPFAVPISLQGYFSSDQWNQICSSFNRVKETAHCWACCGEIACCLIFVFPFIFLCHPCFYTALREGMLTNELRRMNQAFFGGSPVLNHVNGNLVVNTAFLQPSVVVATVNPAYPVNSAAPIVVEPSNVKYSSSTEAYEVTATPTSAPVATAVASQSRVFVVTLPPNISVGQTVQVSAPTGEVVQVTIPPGSVPGQQIMVQY